MTPTRMAPQRSSPLRLALGVLVVALIAVVVTRWVEGPSVTSAVPSGAHAIVIKNFSFTPTRLTVAGGTALGFDDSSPSDVFTATEDTNGERDELFDRTALDNTWLFFC